MSPFFGNTSTKDERYIYQTTNRELKVYREQCKAQLREFQGKNLLTSNWEPHFDTKLLTSSRTPNRLWLNDGPFHAQSQAKIQTQRRLRVGETERKLHS